jgi:hypothetical protein
MGNLMQQVSGKANVTVSRDGILISKDSKEGSDLIDEALKYNGQLPARTTPHAPTNRSPKETPATRTNTNGATPAAANTPTPAPAAIKP